MKAEIVVPQIGEAVAALRLANWLKAVGDPVKKGDALFEVDSDKAIVEVESVFEGTLAEILAPAGSEVMPNQVVAVVETPGEASVATPPTSMPAAQTRSEPRGNGRQASPLARRVADELGIDLQNVPGSGPQGRIVTSDVRQFAQQRAPVTAASAPRVNASPKAKRLAREAGIDLRTLSGARVDGMIRAFDVQQAVSLSAEKEPASGIAPLSKLRQTVALRTQESKQTVPHFYLMADVDMTQANRLREYCRSGLGWDKAPTYTALLIRACALALADLPMANQSYGDGGLIARNTINIGVAVDTDSGLLVPVIPGADTLSLREVSDVLKAAAERARKGALRPSDLGEKSMIVSNLGMYSIDTFIAIIDQPDPMILAVGRVADRFVPVNGQPVIQPMCTLTLSVDHRVLDGAQGARFLERVKNRLENPYELMGQPS